MNVKVLQPIISHCCSRNREIIDKQKAGQEGGNPPLSAGVFNSFRSAVNQDQPSLLHKPTRRREHQLLK